MQLTATAVHLAPGSSVMSITCRAEKRDTQHRIDSERGHRRSARRNRTRTRLHTATADRRRTFVTTMLDAGVDLRDVQIAASHADPRTTMRYDRARKNLDRHPNYILAAYMASGT